MKLNMRDRVVLLGILPTEGDFATLKTITQLRESLLPSGEEVKTYGITQDGMQIAWNAKGNDPVEIPITELGVCLVVDELKRLDAEKKLKIDDLALWEKFMGSEPAV